MDKYAELKIELGPEYGEFYADGRVRLSLASEVNAAALMLDVADRYALSNMLEVSDPWPLVIDGHNGADVKAKVLDSGEGILRLGLEQDGAHALLTFHLSAKDVDRLRVALSGVEKQVVYTCRECGGSNVLQDAWVPLNDPDDVRLFDAIFCTDCDSKCTAIEQDQYKVSGV